MGVTDNENNSLYFCLARIEFFCLLSGSNICLYALYEIICNIEWNNLNEIKVFDLFIAWWLQYLSALSNQQLLFIYYLFLFFVRLTPQKSYDTKVTK